MPQPFRAKLDFVLKAMCIGRGQLAAALEVDKSVVGRWVRGEVKPSRDNLARLTALVAARVTSFTILDWERDLAGLARVLGVDPQTAAEAAALSLAVGPYAELLDQALVATRRRGAAYEGFYRSTRPYAERPGRFIHDRIMIRREEDGLLRVRLCCLGVKVEGLALPQQNQLFVIGAEDASGSLAFGIFNGVSGARAEVIDGLMLSCALDANRTPTARPTLIERVGDLSGAAAEDEARFAAMAPLEGLAAEGSVPEPVVAHLSRDTGPTALALGGDWLLRLPLARSLSQGLLAK